MVELYTTRIKEESVDYYNKMLTSYPELQELDVEKQLETIYNFKFSDLEKVADECLKITKDSDLGRNITNGSFCQTLLESTVLILEVAVILDSVGMTDFSNALLDLGAVMLNVYTLFCGPGYLPGR